MNRFHFVGILIPCLLGKVNNFIICLFIFRDEDLYKPKHQKFKTQFEIDFEDKWREKFGESYHGGL